jgi:WhiB family redox-sensing transcriptional regulator
LAKFKPFSLPGDWIEQALCCEVGSETFFPPDDKPVTRDFYAKAKTVCNNCPVIDKCLDYGIYDEYGVFGGTTPSERRIMRDQRGITK